MCGTAHPYSQILRFSSQGEQTHTLDHWSNALENPLESAPGFAHNYYKAGGTAYRATSDRLCKIDVHIPMIGVVVGAGVSAVGLPLLGLTARPITSAALSIPGRAVTGFFPTRHRTSFCLL